MESGIAEVMNAAAVVVVVVTVAATIAAMMSGGRRGQVRTEVLKPKYDLSFPVRVFEEEASQIAAMMRRSFTLLVFFVAAAVVTQRAEGKVGHGAHVEMVQRMRHQAPVVESAKPMINDSAIPNAERLPAKPPEATVESAATGGDLPSVRCVQTKGDEALYT